METPENIPQIQPDKGFVREMSKKAFGFDRYFVWPTNAAEPRNPQGDSEKAFEIWKRACTFEVVDNSYHTPGVLTAVNTDALLEMRHFLQVSEGYEDRIAVVDSLLAQAATINSPEYQRVAKHVFIEEKIINKQEREKSQRENIEFLANLNKLKEE